MLLFPGTNAAVQPWAPSLERRCQRRVAARCVRPASSLDDATAGSSQEPASSPVEPPQQTATSQPSPVRRRLAALRQSVFKAGGNARDSLLQRLPVVGTPSRLRALAKAADAAPDDAAKQDAYLEALAKHRCVCRRCVLAVTSTPLTLSCAALARRLHASSPTRGPVARPACRHIWPL